MNKKNKGLIFALFVLIVYTANTNAQLWQGNAYLKNEFIQAALHPNGVYGATEGSTICPGYESPDNAVGYDQFNNEVRNGPLGFIASPDNNWPFYYGDFMLPGTPYEGFTIAFKDNFGIQRRYENNRGANPSYPYAKYEFTTLSPAFVYNSNTAEGVYDDVTWYGQAGDYIRLECRFHLEGRRILHYTKIINISETTLTNIYFARGLDPDQENGKNSAGISPNCSTGAATRNIIKSQADGTPGKPSWVVANGYCAHSSIALYSKEPESRVGISELWYELLRKPEYAFIETNSPASLFMNEGEFRNGDNTIELAISAGNLAPGDSITLEHEIRLDQPPVIFFEDPSILIQNEGTTFNYNLIRRYQTDETVTVTVRLTDNSNLTPADIVGVPSLPHDYTVVFLPHDTIKTLSIQAALDCYNIPNKNFKLEIISVTSKFGGMATMPSFVIGVILDIPNPSCTPPCNACPASFAPIPGNKYVFSGWVKDPGALENDSVNYSNCYISLIFDLLDGTADNSKKVYPSGSIIDGWQRMQEVIEIPANAHKMRMELVNNTDSEDIYFDDIRVYPFNGNMKSYVYDPVTRRLAAELDDENYATIYEYDEEGALIRVKKETERGIMTIREARQGQRKVSQP